MNRRSFNTKMGILGAASILPLQACSRTESHKFKMGYQLFSVNQEMNDDPINTLKALKAMGYQDFEIYGFDDKKVTYYGIDANEFKKQLDDLELSVTSGHYGFASYLSQSEDELKRFVDQCIKGAKALKSPYITWPWIAPEQRNMETFKLMTGKLNLIGEQIKAAGLGFAYHNHGFEFDEHDEGIGYDVIMQETDPDLVKLQIDMYWVMHSSKLTPKEWIAKQPGRFVMWHIKDMDKVTRDYTELGNGSINYEEIMPDPAESGLEYYYLEQGGNYAHSPMKSAEDSGVFFKANLQKYL